MVDSSGPVWLLAQVYVGIHFPLDVNCTRAFIASAVGYLHRQFVQ